MKKNKFLEIMTIPTLGLITIVSLSSCSINYQSNGTLKTYVATDFLTNNNSPLNSSFNNSPMGTYAQSSLLNLTTYQTIGNFSFDEKGNTKTKTSDYLTLDAAKAVLVFKDESIANKIETYLKENVPNFDLNNEGNLSDSDYGKLINSLKNKIITTKEVFATELMEGRDYWVFQRSKGALQFQQGIENDAWDPSKTTSSNLTNYASTIANSGTVEKEAQPSDISINSQTKYYQNAISNGKVYQFIIDTDNQWVDNKGESKANVSSKDFERAIESYSLASSLNYNRNGYFMDLIGLDFDKTCGYSGNGNSNYNSNNSIDWTKFDISNYKNKNNSVFTLYINTGYPYTFGLLSKEYFAALPHENQKVKNINLQSGSSIIVTDTGAIDQNNTGWNKIYGSGGLGVFNQDVWSAGAYYVSAFTSANIIFKLNKTYKETVGKYLLNHSNGSPLNGNTSNQSEARIERIVVTYGSGSDDTFYELFKSKQNDFLSSVPSSKMSEAAKLFKDNGLLPKKIVQTSKSNYIAYTPNPYVLTTDGKVNTNSYMGNMAKFIYKWNSKESYTIRAAIAGLINWYQLSLINLPISGDFQLSATPYGVFSNYYEQVANQNLAGGLPRSFNDYKSSSSTILEEFEVPYYSYSDTNVQVENLKINQSSLKNALISYGASASNPLQFSIKFGEGSFSSNYNNFLNRMKQVIESLSGNLIKITIMPRLSTSPSLSEWYNKQAAPLGFSYWSPDYNGVGTWVEAETTLQSKTVNSSTVEGVPATNAHNAFITFLSSMVTAYITNNRGDNNLNKNIISKDKTLTNYKETNIFDNDSRISKTFSDDSLKAMGVTIPTNKLLSNITSINNSNDVNTIISTTNMTAGNRYALLAIDLLELLIKNEVFDEQKFNAYVIKPSKLNYTETPKVANDLYIGNDIIKPGKSSDFSKWLGVYAGKGTLQALYVNTVLDGDYSYIPRSESGLNDKIYSLVNPNYNARVGTQSTNYRDFGWKQ